jgi:hypothetical protein
VVNFRKWIDLGHVGLKKNPEMGRSWPSGPSNVWKRVKKRRKSALFLRILDSKATFLTKIVRQLVDLDEVGTFGVDDSIFQLDDEVEEGVDGGRTNRSSEKKENFYFFSL